LGVALGLQYDFVDLTQAVAAILREPKIIEAWASGKIAFTPMRATDAPKVVANSS
jgi:hypothetical protein